MAAAALAPQSSPSLSSTTRWSSSCSITAGSPNSLLERRAAANPFCLASLCLNISPICRAGRRQHGDLEIFHVEIIHFLSA